MYRVLARYSCGSARVWFWTDFVVWPSYVRAAQRPQDVARHARNYYFVDILHLGHRQKVRKHAYERPTHFANFAGRNFSPA